MNKRCVPFVFICCCSLLAGCIAPTTQQTNATKAANKCLSNGKSISDARACLGSAGFEAANPPKRGALHFKKCAPYWGWPFMASCEGIIVTIESQAVEGWQAWGELDGV